MRHIVRELTSVDSMKTMLHDNNKLLDLICVAENVIKIQKHEKKYKFKAKYIIFSLFFTCL